MRRVRSALREEVFTLGCVVGYAAFVVGVALIYVPASLILGGAVLALVCVLPSRH